MTRDELYSILKKFYSIRKDTSDLQILYGDRPNIIEVLYTQREYLTLRSQILRKHSTSPVTVRIDLGKMTIRKSEEANSPSGMSKTFDRDELKFFDELGFELDKIFVMNTEQNISDWWEE